MFLFHLPVLPTSQSTKLCSPGCSLGFHLLRTPETFIKQWMATGEGQTIAVPHMGNRISSKRKTKQLSNSISTLFCLPFYQGFSWGLLSSDYRTCWKLVVGCAGGVPVYDPTQLAQLQTTRNLTNILPSMGITAKQPVFHKTIDLAIYSIATPCVEVKSVNSWRNELSKVNFFKDCAISAILTNIIFWNP